MFKAARTNDTKGIFKTIHEMKSSMETLKPGINQKQWNVQAEGRTKLYREWRMVGRFGAVQDIDQLEYVIVEGKIKPVAIVELCKAEDWIRNPDAYLVTVDKNRARQQEVASTTARLLGIPAFYLVFEDNFDRFFVRNLTNNDNFWLKFCPDEWRSVLISLAKAVIARTIKTPPTQIELFEPRSFL